MKKIKINMEYLINGNVIKLEKGPGGIICYISKKNGEQKYYAMNQKGVLYEYINKDYKMINDDGIKCEENFVNFIMSCIDEKRPFVYELIYGCLSHISSDKPIYWLSGNKINIFDDQITMDYKELSITIYIPETNCDLKKYFLGQLEIIENKYNNIIRLKINEQRKPNNKLKCLKQKK